MGILGDFGRIIIGGALGGAAGAISIFTLDHGEDVVEGTIDAARQIVKIGSDIYRAIPPEAFLLAGDPLHGLLKHEAEDEIIWIGQIGANAVLFSGLTWPALGPLVPIAEGVVPLWISVGSIVGKIVHRSLNDQEWEMAQYIFRGTLLDRSEIVLTNLAGVDGRPFVYPSTTGSVFVNLGPDYAHAATTPNGPLLFHELTHVWQLKQHVLSEIFLYEARVNLGDETPYTFDAGSQWAGYDLEQQAAIVEAWMLGATKHPFDASTVPRPAPPLRARGEFTIGSPLFRYINGNIRRGDTSATTSDGRSARQLLREGGHSAMRQMHTRPPTVWW
jgi:hypothetical protein